MNNEIRKLYTIHSYLDNTPRVVANITEIGNRSRYRILRNIEGELSKNGVLESYRDVLANSYYELAEDSSICSKEIMAKCLDKFKNMSTTGRIPGTFFHRIFRIVLGVHSKKKLFSFLRYKCGIQPFKSISYVKTLNELYLYDRV